jgi:hypothetical protein
VEYDREKKKFKILKIIKCRDARKDPRSARIESEFHIKAGKMLQNADIAV